MSVENDLRDWSRTRTLYVVLQGEFALYQQPSGDNQVNDTIRIVAPNLPAHQYKAGPWLTDWKNQCELPCRPLTFKNTFGDQKGYDGNHCPHSIPENNTDSILTLGEELPNPEGARLDITAPMPVAILSGLVETTDTVKITVNHGHGGSKYPPVPDFPTLIPILVYKWFVGCSPYLWDEATCTKWLPGGPSEYFQSLHIYASSACAAEEHNVDHTKAAFHAAAALLGEDATVDWDAAGFPMIFATPPAGLSWAQVNLTYSDVVMFDPCDPRLTLNYWDYVHDPNKPHADGYAVTSASTGNCGPIIGGGGH
jgi:hypothetical protein